MGQWSLTSHARIETVDEEDEKEKEDDAVQPEPSNNVPGLGTTVHDPSEMEYDATRVESGENIESTVRQNTKPLGTVEFDDSEGDTTLHSIPKLNDSPTKTPAIHNMLNAPQPGSSCGP